ncbi:MAG: N-acetylmuramoyl-L-alanine amidase [Thermoprotei archaeon]|nr:MAG: N-acetylmuramoyl-L-alanine amidase [Thermoprotei archaeon]
MPKPVRRIALRICKGRKRLYDEVVNILKEKLIEYTDVEEGIKGFDAVLVVGTDRDLLETLQYMPKKPIPILHVSPPGYTAFFTALEWESLSEGIEKLERGEYELESTTRVKAIVDGEKYFYALNEAAVFASRSAVLMNYALLIDGEEVWRDTGDGVIIATPTGSTAYALSAGGPIVVKNAPVLVVVPVNSLNPMRKPLVVPDTSTIEIRDIASSTKCEIVVDGVIRHRVRRSVTVVKAEYPALFIRMKKKLVESIERKTRIALEVSNVPPSAKFVYKMLEIHGEASIRELVELTGLPERTVRYALSTLIEKGLVEKVISIRDARRRIYRLTRKPV